MHARNPRRLAAGLLAVTLTLGGETLAADTPTPSAPPAPTPASQSPAPAQGADAGTTPGAKAVEANTPAASAPAASHAPAQGAPAAKKPAKGPAKPAVTAAPSTAVVQDMTPVDLRVNYHYNALGRRDPFQSLVEGFVGADVGGDAPVDVGGIQVVGIVWGVRDKFALVEDGRGNSLVLRRGDKVMNGVVQSIRRDAIVVQLSADGQTQSVDIPLTRKGDQSNANR